MEITEEDEKEQVMPVQLQGVGSREFQLERERFGSSRDCFDWRRKRPSWLRERDGWREKLKMMMKKKKKKKRMVAGVALF